MNGQNSRHDVNKEETPHSRIFIVCDKQLRDSDLRNVFQKFGVIENLYMPKDRNTGGSRGVAYIKYSKTSSAANAIHEMHLKTAKSETKLMKVMIAANKNESHQNTSEDRYTRLFIKVSKEATEQEIKKHFESFGKIESIFLQKNKLTDEAKGFAYVKYGSFVDAAKAFEECDKKYRAVFAMPRDELKRSRKTLETNSVKPGNTGNRDRNHDSYSSFRDDSDVTSLILTKVNSYKSVIANCSPQVPQKHIASLFNIIPGMVQCQYSVDTYNGLCKATVTYQEEKAAAYAVEKLNGFEFPSGELLSVKPNNNPLAKAATSLTDIINTFKNGIDSQPELTMLAEAIAQASTLIKVAANKSEFSEETRKFNCNVDLPPPEPMAKNNSEVAMRLFIVCKPQPPSPSVLRDLFCRFGNLIHVSSFPNKTFGFVKYASTKSAQQAIRVLNGAMIGGIKLRVMEATEKPSAEECIDINDGEPDEKEDDSIDRKRMKLESE